MIVGFSKLFADIIHSTVWREPMHVKVVWITMLAMSDRHGQVFASIPGLADSAKVSLEECIEALEVFSSPDQYSRTKDYEGRRIIEIDGGWLLLNYEKFRERRDDEEQRIQTRDRVRRHREKAKGLCNDVTESVTATQCNDIAEADTEAEAKTEEKSSGEQPRKRKAKQTTQEWLTVLKKEPCYAHVNFDHELGKAQVWINDHPGRQLTKPFFTAWINKIPAPLILNGNGSQNTGCDICRNHPNRKLVSLKTYGWIFNAETRQLEDCICKNGTT